MKVTVEQAALLKALGHVYRVVERRNTIPILSNVLIRTEERRLWLKATDLDIEVTEVIEADVSEAGTTTVPAHVLHDIVRKLSDGAQVSLEQSGDGAQLLLRSGRSRFTLQSLPATDFPDLAAGALSHKFDVAATELKRLVEKTQFAISTEETRYYLNGIYLHAIATDAGTMLRAVATDGHRLAQADTPAPAGAVGMPGVIVPKKTVGEIQKLLAEASGDISVELSTAKIRFSVGSVVFTSKLIDGTYPDYLRVIPTRNDKRAEASIEDLAAAVDRVSTITNANGRAVKLAFTEGKLTLTVRNPDAGDATDELPITYTSADLEIGFNGAYLADILAALSGDTAIIELAEPGSPALLTTPTDPAFCVVIMPMRV